MTHEPKFQLTSNGHVTEEEPSGDESLLGVAWWFLHDVQVRWVEAEGSGGEAVSHEVHPEQLYGNQGLWDAQGGRQEDAEITRQELEVWLGVFMVAMLPSLALFIVLRKRQLILS